MTHASQSKNERGSQDFNQSQNEDLKVSKSPSKAQRAKAALKEEERL